MTDLPLQQPIAPRAYTALGSLEQELSLSPDQSYCFDLDYLGLIRIEGAGATDYLQGQLTADMRRLGPSHFCQAAYCNQKGRVLALLEVFEWQGLHMALPRDLSAATIESLNKTAVFSKIKLVLDADFVCLGLALEQGAEQALCGLALPKLPGELIQTEQYCLYRLSPRLCLLWARPDYQAQVKAAYQQQGRLRGSAAWHYLRLQQQLPEIEPASRGLFLPHRLNLPALGYIAFDKGCYRGQEIIARMQYRGKQKYQLALLAWSKEPLRPGDSLLDELSGQAIGEWIDSCPLADGSYLALVSIRISANEANV